MLPTHLGRLQRKVLVVIITLVIVPMLVAGALAAEWVSRSFEQRLAQWIKEAAHADVAWLKAYQNNAVMLGEVLSRDPEFLAYLQAQGIVYLDPRLRRVIEELGIAFIHVYKRDGSLMYSSSPLRLHRRWEPGQAHAVLKVRGDPKSPLAAVGITAIPADAPQHHLVLGSLLNKDFIDELSQLSGLRTRLYYREGKGYYDLFSVPGRAQPLPTLNKEALRRLERDKQPYYDVRAELGTFRGLYTPVVDSSGQVEAIMFSGLERRGFMEAMTNRVLLFGGISLLGILIGGLTGLVISREVLQPIEHLRNAAMQVAAQDFNAAVPVKGDDEVADLAKAFNAMAARLRIAHDEQQQRFQRDKLAAIGELSAALAHEIRNPIGVINTACALLDKPDADPQKRATLMRMIREESQRVSALVQEFLHFARPRPPARGLIDPAASLERAASAMLAGKDKVTARWKLEHGGRRIHADAAQLQQVCSNLVLNALEAMGERGGTIWFESRCEGEHVVLAIEDEGPGIPAEVMPRLFEPFFTSKEHGTGLGLSIARALVEANDGVLEIARARRGARFELRFRAADHRERAV